MFMSMQVHQALDPLDLESQTVVKDHMGAGN